MNDITVLQVLVVGGLAALASAAALLAGRGPAKEYRHRRRRARLHVIAGGAARTPRRRRLGPANAAPATRMAATATWEALPITQWQPPRDHEEKPSPSPAA
jgi:hypothetical protein